MRLAEKHGKRVHVLHVSTAEEMAFLAEHKDWASVEVTPHHLTLVAPDCYQRLGTFAQMNPPVRDDAPSRRRSGPALASGVVDVLGSDHAPHTREEKDHPYPESHSGMTGVQTLVPIMLDHVNAGRLTLERFVDLTSHGPQRLFGIRGKGRIAVGYDADLTIVDLKRRETITDDWIQLAQRLDALRRRQRAGLAGRHHRARTARDVGGRDRRPRHRAAGQVPGADALLTSHLSSRPERSSEPGPRAVRTAAGSRMTRSRAFRDDSVSRGSTGWHWPASSASPLPSAGPPGRRPACPAPAAGG